MAAPSYYDNSTNEILDGTVAQASDVENKCDDIAASMADVAADMDNTIRFINIDFTDQTISGNATTRANKAVGFDASGNAALLPGAVRFSASDFGDQTLTEESADRAYKVIGFDASGDAVLRDVLNGAFIDGILIASKEEAESGTDNAVFMTPLRTRQAVLAMTTVPLNGPTSAHVTTSISWTITDYDVFSVYAVSASAGTVSRTTDTINYTAPETVGTAIITITVNDMAHSVSIDILPASIATPTNSAPADLATDQYETVELSASTFSYFGPATTHASSDWQLASDSGFSTIVQSASADSSNKTTWSVSGLSVSTHYYWRVRYRSASGLVSDWSAGTRFTTKSLFTSYIATPAATPTNYGDAFEGGFYAGLIWNQIAQSSSSKALATGTQTFSVPDMTHAPIVYVGQTVEVRSRANPANKFVGTVTEAAVTDLTLNVSSIGGSGTYSDWSVMARFRVIVAPKSSGENAGASIKNATTALPTTCQTLTEGFASTQAMKDADTSTVYPAAHWARGLSIGGYSDWHIPARDALELCWRNLKPVTNNNYVTADRSTSASFSYANNGSVGDTANTHGTNNNSSSTGSAYTTSVPGQTAATAFRTGGAEVFEFGSAYYWSSSEYSTSSVWAQYWYSSYPGPQYSTTKTTPHRVRAVRRSII